MGVAPPKNPTRNTKKHNICYPHREDEITRSWKVNNKKRYRNNRFEIRLFDEEVEILENKAKIQGLSKTEYIREIILYSEIKDNKRNILSDENFKKLLYEINRIGNNINQIAYNSNLIKSTGREEIKNLKEQYENLLQLYTDTFVFNGEEKDGYYEES